EVELNWKILLDRHQSLAEHDVVPVLREGGFDATLGQLLQPLEECFHRAEISHQLGGGLLPHTGDAGNVVGGVPPQRLEVDQLSWLQAVALPVLVGAVHRRVRDPTPGYQRDGQHRGEAVGGGGPLPARGARRRQRKEGPVNEAVGVDQDQPSAPRTLRHHPILGRAQRPPREAPGCARMIDPIEGLIEVAVDSIRVHMPTGQHVVILKEKGADRYLPIWIGVYEANAIALKITGITPDRPITHDLMASTLGQLDVRLSRIVVTSLANDVFFARLYLRQDGREVDIDARPSDAIALAVRLECPILMAPEVLEKAGVLPEKGEEEDVSRAEEDRLAVFRDLVNSLDLPELPDEPKGEGEGGGSN